MNTRPILMSAPMVLANLARRKTQTRRIIKPQPYFDKQNNLVFNKWCFGQEGGDKHTLPFRNMAKRCPYGTIGDRLYVRERIWNDCNDSWLYGADHKFLPMDYPEGWLAKVDHKRSIPAIHMPRWASRIMLEITNIRVERLQDITEDDAIEEGIDFEPDYDLWMDYERKQWFCVDPIDSYKSLINSINGAKAWDSNPWVWVVEYKIIEIKGGEK